MIAAYALHTAELYLARLWLPLLLGASLVRSGYDAGEAVSLAAALAGFMFMTGTGSVLAGGWLSDRLGRSAAAALIFSASGACSFAAGWLVGLPPAYLIGLGFVYGFVTAADSAIYSTAVTELAPRGRVGSTQAVQSFVGFGIGATAPRAGGVDPGRVGLGDGVGAGLQLQRRAGRDRGGVSRVAQEAQHGEE